MSGGPVGIGGVARYSGGLSVFDFLRVRTFIECQEADIASEAGPAATAWLLKASVYSLSRPDGDACVCN